MKKGGKIAGIIALVLVVLVVGGIATLWIMFPPQKIKELVIPQVEKILGREIVVKKAGLSIYPVLGVSFSGVEIANSKREGFLPEPFIKLDKFLVQIGVMSIFKGEPQIEKILLERPFVCLEKDLNGSFNFEDMSILESKDTTKIEEKKKGGLPVLPVPITLKLFTIDNGSAIYIDKKTGQEFTIGDIDLGIAFQIDKELKNIKTTGELNINGVSVKTKELTKPLKDLSVTLSHDVSANLIDGFADVNQLRLSLQKVYLSCTGKVTDLNTEPNFDLRVISDSIPIHDLLKEIPVELVPVIAQLSASGFASCDVAFKGTLADIETLPIKGKMALKNCNIKYKSLPKAINELNTYVSFTGNSASIHDFKMRFGDNPFSLKGTVNDFKKPQIDIALDAKIDLNDVKNIIEIPKEAALSGSIVANVIAKGEVDPSDPSKLDVNGITDLKNVSVMWSPLLKPAIINGEFNLSSKAIGENLDVSIGKSSLSMSASVTNYLSLVFGDSTKSLPRPSINFVLKSKYLDVNEIVAVKSNTESANNNKSVANTPSQSANSNIPPLVLPGIDMKGNVTATKIIYDNIHMDKLNMTVSVVKDIADITFNTGFSRGTISDKMHVDLRNTKNVSFTNKLAIKSIEINELLKRFGGFVQPTTPLNRELINLQKSLYGKVNLDCNLAGNGGKSEEIMKTLNGKLTASVDNGKISNSLILKNISKNVEKFINIDDINFRNLSTTLLIADEKVKFEKFSIKSDHSGDWGATGSVGFDAGLDIGITDRLTKSVSSKVLSVQSSGKDALKGLLKGTQVASVASNLIDNTGIPSDKDGRVTIKLALRGNASDPKVSFVGFGEGSNSSGSVAKDAKTKVVEDVKSALNAKKQELEAKVNEERRNAEADLKKKAQEKKAVVNQEIKKQAEDVKKKAVGKLKKLF